MTDMAEFHLSSNKATRVGNSNQKPGGGRGSRTAGDNMGKGRKGEKGEGTPQKRSHSKDSKKKRSGYTMTIGQSAEEETLTGAQKIKRRKWKLKLVWKTLKWTKSNMSLGNKD